MKLSDEYVQCWKINCSPPIEVYKTHINYFGRNIDIDRVDGEIKEMDRKTDFLKKAKEVWEQKFNKIRKCTQCGKKATKQTEKGKENEKINGLPQNDGYYCDKCWDIGVKLENEAMYGN